MPPDPLYRHDNLRPPAYQLRYGWTGWPWKSAFPPEPDEGFFDDLAEAWERDGLRLLERRWTDRQLQFTFSATPRVTPATLAQRTKGRLSFALGETGEDVEFSRNFAVQTIGDVRREDVESYIDEQVGEARFADERHAEMLRRWTDLDSSVDLAQPSASKRGRYWYNLHLVLVVEGRVDIGSPEKLRTIRNQCRRVAAAKGHGLSALSVMPDHLHAGLRAHYSQSPEDVALAYLNNTAYAMGQRPIWEDSYYVGSFGEYDMDAVRTSWGDAG